MPPRKKRGSSGGGSPKEEHVPAEQQGAGGAATGAATPRDALRQQEADAARDFNQDAGIAPPTHAPRERRTRVLLLGAAGRDYHNFFSLYRCDARYEVVGIAHAFSQIPDIKSKR